MGRFTKVYSPEPLVFAVRVNAVCSSTAVTVALGMTPPEASVTTPGDAAERLLCPQEGTTQRNGRYKSQQPGK